jgi:hypothetical protein
MYEGSSGAANERLPPQGVITALVTRRASTSARARAASASL